MNDLISSGVRIPPMSLESIGKVRQLEAITQQLPQVDIATDHVLHGGMYARTICIPAGVVLTGAFIKIPTLLIFNGDATVNAGDDAMTLSGYHVIPASKHRRQAFLAHEDTYLTMLFPTSAITVEEAEDEFTNEAHLLFSRKSDAVNHIRITGE